MLITWYFKAMFGASSTFNFVKPISPENSSASSSTIGETILQGPHHGAQKSTKTGFSEPRTSS